MATISEVARHLGVDRDTVKTWTTEFAEHLSLTANPPKGKERQFCETDLRVLAFVAELRRAQRRAFFRVRPLAHARLSRSTRRDRRNVAACSGGRRDGEPESAASRKGLQDGGGRAFEASI